MDIAEDVERVMGELQKSVNANGNVNLLFMLQEVINLFERIKETLPATNIEDRVHFFQSLTKLHEFLMAESHRLAEKTGISEAQMLRYAENPDNFTKEQWSLLTEVKKKMGRQAQDMKQIMGQLTQQTVPHGPGAELSLKKGAPKPQGRKMTSRRGSQIKA